MLPESVQMVSKTMYAQLGVLVKRRGRPTKAEEVVKHRMAMISGNEWGVGNGR